ncbi:MAG: preprotein translocase subunit YajC [Helicobacteraceae bacterium]|jgi:preprotein translocase subunit YajC|nr:preprotein translocase subunit YajC [Helicobacteraceae bacterium]
MPDASTAAAAPNMLSMLLPLLGMFVIFYILLIYPQQRQAKKHKEMTRSLQRGDRIVTVGGIHAEVVRADENEEFIKVEISKDAIVKLDRASVAKKIEADVVKS